MGIINRLIGRTPSPNGNGHAAQVKAVPNPPVSFIPRDNQGRTIENPLYATSSAAHVHRLTAFAAAAYCYVAMKYRADKVSEAPLMVVQESDDGEEWIQQHPLGPWLDAPSPDFDGGELVALTRMYRDMTGMALWVKNRNRGERTATITPFSAEEFEVRPADGRIYGRFIVQTSTGPRSYGPDDVIFFRELNPTDWWHGLAPVDVALSLLNLGQEVTATAKNLLRNAVFPSVVIQTDKEWQPSPEEWEEFKAQLDEHASLDNKGQPLAITGGGRATVVSAKIADLMPAELMDRIEATVASVFGVPAVVLQFLVGLKNSPWSQMEEARRMCYEDTIEPLWSKDEKVLTRQLLREFDEDPSHYIRFDRSRIRALQADDTKRSAVAAQMSIAWTVDEMRIYTGKEPLPEGDPRAEIIPGLQAAPAPGTATGEDAVDDDGDRGASVSARRSRPSLKAATDPRDVAWTRFDATASAQEDAWLSAVSRQLQKDRRRILELADETFGRAKAGEAMRAELVRRLIAEIDAYAAFVRGDWLGLLTPLIESTGRTATRTLSAELGIAWDVLTPGLDDYVQEHSAWLVTEINRTTRDAIASSLETGLRNGERIEQLRARIQGADAAFGTSRAELIARTETTMATNGAQRSSMSRYKAESGQRVEKSWLSARDARVRDEHRALDDESWIDVDAAFPNGLLQPGEPNCRCTTLYRIPEDDE